MSRLDLNFFFTTTVLLDFHYTVVEKIDAFMGKEIEKTVKKKK